MHPFYISFNLRAHQMTFLLKKQIGIFLFLFAVIFSLQAQVNDSIPSSSNILDTTAVIQEQAITDTLKEKRAFLQMFKKEDGLPNPNTALIMSLVVPGSGQIYNGRWWKVPFVYGGLGGLAYLIDFNTNEYLTLRTAYKRKVMGLPHQFSGSNLDNAATLKRFRDAADKNRQLSYFGFAAVWLVGGAEAFVDAHLLNFDVSDDLSFQIQPSFEPTPDNFSAIGVGISFDLNKSEKNKYKVLFP